MPSLNEIWPVLKEFLRVGPVGAVAIVMLWLWYAKDKELRKERQERLADEKEHKKEMLKLQAATIRDHADVIRQYDMTLTSVTMLVERLEETLGD
jgi:hypothetical protein